jgi:hypothetical protein
MLCNLQLRTVELLNLLIAPPGYWGSFLAKTRVLSLHHNVETLSGAYPVATDVPRPEADHSSVSVAEVKNTWGCTFTFQSFMVCSIKQKKTLPFIRNEITPI